MKIHSSALAGAVSCWRCVYARGRHPVRAQPCSCTGQGPASAWVGWWAPSTTPSGTAGTRWAAGRARPGAGLEEMWDCLWLVDAHGAESIPEGAGALHHCWVLAGALPRARLWCRGGSFPVKHRGACKGGGSTPRALRAQPFLPHCACLGRSGLEGTDQIYKS